MKKIALIFICMASALWSSQENVLFNLLIQNEVFDENQHNQIVEIIKFELNKITKELKLRSENTTKLNEMIVGLSNQIKNALDEWSAKIEFIDNTLKKAQDENNLFIFKEETVKNITIFFDCIARKLEIINSFNNVELYPTFYNQIKPYLAEHIELISYNSYSLLNGYYNYINAIELSTPQTTFQTNRIVDLLFFQMQILKKISLSAIGFIKNQEDMKEKIDIFSKNHENLIKKKFKQLQAYKKNPSLQEPVACQNESDDIDNLRNIITPQIRQLEEGFEKRKALITEKWISRKPRAYTRYIVGSFWLGSTDNMIKKYTNEIKNYEKLLTKIASNIKNNNLVCIYNDEIIKNTVLSYSNMIKALIKYINDAFLLEKNLSSREKKALKKFNDNYISELIKFGNSFLKTFGLDDLEKINENHYSARMSHGIIFLDIDKLKILQDKIDNKIN